MFIVRFQALFFYYGDSFKPVDVICFKRGEDNLSVHFLQWDNHNSIAVKEVFVVFSTPAWVGITVQKLLAGLNLFSAPALLNHEFFHWLFM
jgi:hypothetical protein